MDVDMELSTTQKIENTFENLPTFNDLDFLKINKEINNMMLEISEVLGNYDIMYNNPNINSLHSTNYNTQDSTNIHVSTSNQSIKINFCFYLKCISNKL